MPATLLSTEGENEWSRKVGNDSKDLQYVWNEEKHRGNERVV